MEIKSTRISFLDEVEQAQVDYVGIYTRQSVVRKPYQLHWKRRYCYRQRFAWRSAIRHINRRALHDNLLDDISTGNALHTTLTGDISDANTSKTELNTSKSNADGSKTALDGSINR